MVAATVTAGFGAESEVTGDLIVWATRPHGRRTVSVEIWKAPCVASALEGSHRGRRQRQRWQAHDHRPALGRWRSRLSIRPRRRLASTRRRSAGAVVHQDSCAAQHQNSCPRTAGPAPGRHRLERCRPAAGVGMAGSDHSAARTGNHEPVPSIWPRGIGHGHPVDPRRVSPGWSWLWRRCRRAFRCSRYSSLWWW